MRGLRACVAACLLAAAPASAETVVAGEPAQALRCAAYIGMAAQYGHIEGLVSTESRMRMTWWSVLVLERWVPLAPEARMAAYRSALAELGTRKHTYALIEKHADWCIDTFRPML